MFLRYLVRLIKWFEKIINVKLKQNLKLFFLEISPKKRTKMKEDELNVDLFEELNILGKVILNKPNGFKAVEK